MGFDNECVPNMQSLPGEYFCPVCRMLVCPNEALQSQCTHLYCKPCLTYVVSTTRACPYDGYLVTEADSKPLVESNAALVEAIGKVTVHCLFQRSGCTWQGSLSDCVPHCAGCAFGNSPVVCNRCSVQIVHRQVQEHAQVCPGVQPQPQTQPAQGSQVAAAATPTTAPAAAAAQPPAVAVASQTQTSAATVAAALVLPGQAAAQASAANAIQWYQQQPQYQQYYQQYPGYDAYQQQVQQQYAQYQQPQSQAQPMAQPPVVAQPSSQALANTPQQIYPGVQPATHAYATPQPTSYPQMYPVHQQNLQMPQNQQPFPLMQQAHPQIQPQSQHVQPYTQPLPQPLGSQTNQAQVPSVHSVTDHQAYPQVQLQQQLQPGAPQIPAPLRPLSGPQQQSQVPIQVQTQFPQQPPGLRPPQQPAVLHLAGQTAVLPIQQQAVQSYNVHPGFTAYQQPMQSVQQPMHQQYGQYQQPFSGQPSGPVQPHVNPQGSYLQPRLQGQPQTFPQNALLPQGFQPHQSLAVRPTVQPHAVPQTYAEYTFSAQVKQMQFANQHSFSKTENLGSEQKLGVPPGTMSDNLSAQKNDGKDVATSLGSAGEPKSAKSENGLKLAENEDKSIANSKDVQESHAAVGVVQLSSTVKDEPLVSSVGGIDTSENKEMKDLPVLKPPQLLDAGNPEPKMEKDLHQAPRPQINNGPFGLQQRPPGSSLFQAPPPGPADHLSGYPSGHVRPLGTAHLTQPRGLEFTDGRLVPYVQQSSTHSDAMRMNGPPALNSSSTHRLHDDRFRPSADQHPFAGDPSRHRQFEEGFKHFPWPSQLDGEPALGRVPHLLSSRPLDHGINFAADVAPRPYGMDPLGGPRPFPPHHRGSTLHPADLGDHPFAFREPSQPDFGRAHKNFVGPGSGYLSGRMVGLVPRSPGRDFPGLSSSGFGGFPFRDDIDGRESRQFVDPIDKSFRDGRFGRFPGHFPRDDFDASGIGTVDRVRTSGSIGLDGLPYHVRKGEHLGSHSLPAHLLSRDGFGGLPGQLQMGELVPEAGNSRFGKPGFRSSFPLKDFTSYGGKYTGETESFDVPRKRKPVAMGWCRICKVDCESVEGLDLHSQTGEHQKMAMDMVLIIKQNAKKLKTDATSSTTHVDETKNANSEGHGSCLSF